MFYHPGRSHWRKLEIDGKEHASGAEFLIGFIPYGKLSAIEDAAFEAAAPVRPIFEGDAGRKLTEEERALVHRYQRQTEVVDEDYVRFGVRGHRSIVGDDGQEVPFKADKADFNGRSIDVVSEETLEFYRANGLIRPLSFMVAQLQKLPETTRGN